jgi:hypothetical protein
MPSDNRPSHQVKKLIRFDQSMLNAIDGWRRRRSPIPHASGAIRELIRLGLAASKREESQRPQASVVAGLGDASR